MVCISVKHSLDGSALGLDRRLAHRVADAILALAATQLGDDVGAVQVADVVVGRAVAHRQSEESGLPEGASGLFQRGSRVD